MSVALIPMMIPYPRTEYRYIGAGSSNYAVESQTRQQQTNHRELMGAIGELSKVKIAVTVRAGDILPFANQAEAALDGPAQDYEAAIGRWRSRISRVRGWQDKRKAAKKAAERDAKKERLALAAQEYVRTHSRWYRRVTIEQAIARVSECSPWDDYGYHDLYRELLFHREEFLASRPKKPSGYDDLPAIRELKLAASLSRDAVLTVPVDVITKVQRWTA